MPPKKKEYSKYAIAADAIGLSHLVLCSVIILLGEITGIFTKFDYEHGGIAVVTNYLDAPVAVLLKPWLPLAEGDRTYMILAALAIVVLASIVYGVLTYLILRFVASLFKPAA